MLTPDNLGFLLFLNGILKKFLIPVNGEIQINAIPLKKKFWVKGKGEMKWIQRN